MFLVCEDLKYVLNVLDTTWSKAVKYALHLNSSYLHGVSVFGKLKIVWKTGGGIGQIHRCSHTERTVEAPIVCDAVSCRRCTQERRLPPG
jgi:hypothetical protein